MLNQEVEEKWAYLIVIVVTLVVAAFATLRVISAMDTAAQVEELQRQVAYAQQELEDAQATSVASVDDAKTQLHNASEAGDAVAKLQNSAKGGLDGDALSEFGQEMRKYMKDSGAIMFWYSSDTADYIWKFASSFDFAGDSLDCVWLAQDEADDQVLSYAYATYDVESKMFTDFSVHATVVGSKRSAVTVNMQPEASNGGTNSDAADMSTDDVNIGDVGGDETDADVDADIGEVAEDPFVYAGEDDENESSDNGVSSDNTRAV